MTPHDASALLTIAAAFDNRTVTEAAARAWAEAIHPAVTLEEGRQAIVQHYARTRDWVMPSDVNRGSRSARLARITATPVPEPPAELDPADAAREQVWIRAWTAAIGDGRTPDEADRAAARAARITYTPRLTARTTPQIGDRS